MHARMHSCAACPPVARVHAGAASARVPVVIECAPGSRAHLIKYTCAYGASLTLPRPSPPPYPPPSPSPNYGAAEPRRTSG